MGAVPSSRADGRSMDRRHEQHGRLTRRRALALGGAAAATALGRRALEPVDALAAPHGLGLTVAPDAFGRGGRTAALRAPSRFVLAGVREPRALGTHVELRTRRGGGPWSRWVTLRSHGDHAPDRDAAPRASDPIWTGPADELQLRAAGRPRRPVRLALVALPTGARAALAARAAADLRTAQFGGRPPIVSRAAWGGNRVLPRSAPSYGIVELAFVHHTESSNAYGPGDSAAIVLSVAKFHRDTRGWSDIGYNFLVDRYGTIFEGRAGGVDQPVIGAHAQGFNRFSTGISVIGSFMGEPAPSAAVDAVARLIGWKLPLHGAPVSGTHTVVSGGGSLSRYPYGTRVRLPRISGHRDAGSTDCPGDQFYRQLPDLRGRAAGVSATPFVTPEVTLAARAAVRYGATARFSGTVLKPDKTPQAGVPVRLERQAANGSWVTLATVVSGADGTFSARAPWKRGGLVRAVALQTISLPVSVGVVPAIEARSDVTVLAAGGVLTVSGTVRPAARVQVVAERRVRGRWRRAAARTIRANGAYAARLKLARAGQYRVTVRATVAGRSTRTPAISVRVDPQAAGSAPAA